MATLSTPTCSGVSYITTGSAMFYPAGAKIEFCLRLKFLQWGRAGEQPLPASPATLGSSTLNLPTEIRMCLVLEGTWPFRLPVRGLKSDHWAFQTRQQICSALPDVQLLPVALFHAHIWDGNAEHPSESSARRICSLILAYCSFLCSP